MSICLRFRLCVIQQVLLFLVGSVAFVEGASLTISTTTDNGRPVMVTDSAQVEVIAGPDSKAIFDADDVHWLSQTGEPQIPWKVMTVLLNPDVDPATVAVTLDHNSTFTSIAGTWQVEPTPPVITWRDGQKIVVWPEGKTIVNGRDSEIYEDNAFWPAARARLLHTGQLRKYKLAKIAVPLVRYNSVSGELQQLDRAEIVVKSNSMAEAHADQAQAMAVSGQIIDEIGKARVKELVINFDQAHPAYETTISQILPSDSSNNGGARMLTAGNPGYTIITTSSIQANSIKLGDFVAYKQGLGFTVQVITETDFGGGIGDTAAENIRSWLQSHYISDNIEYVLFIGNPHPTTGDVPMKFLILNLLSVFEAPSDFYFADLTGNWDLDGDGNYGEAQDDFGPGGVDVYAEVLVGRIPYYGSISELDAILGKSINYEHYTISSWGSIDWRKKVLLPGEPLDEAEPGYALGEGIKNEILSRLGWPSHRIYDEDYGLVPPPEATPCNYTNVTEVWNGTAVGSDGQFGLVEWLTHGSATDAIDVMNTTYVSSLKNTYPSFVFSASCNNAYPEVPGNLMYKLLVNGGVCCIGATREAESSIPLPDPLAGVSQSVGHAFEFCIRIVSGETCGQALYDLKSHLAHGCWANSNVFNIYGDPGLRMVNPSTLLYHVDQDATGGADDGSCWADAFIDLQSALAVAKPGDEIRVAQGLYLPGTQRDDVFRLVPSIKIYGGYAGYGAPDPNLRDIQVFETVLTGDIGIPGDSSDNSYQIVIGSYNVILDGFTIRESNGNAGLTVDHSMTVSNCCFYKNNGGLGYGGGMHIKGKSTVKVSNCVFVRNEGGRGGGIRCSAYCSLDVSNCLFIKNKYGNSGGGIHSHGALWLDNCTFYGNSPWSFVYSEGGGLYHSWDQATITNCIFWNNSANDGGNEIFSPYWGGEVSISYSNIKNSNGSGSSWDTDLGSDGGGNIDLDPLFADTIYDDYHLHHDSPCINAGDPAFVSEPGEVDMDGGPRIQLGRVDMGADEFIYAYMADFNNDDDVDLADFAILGAQWQQPPGEPSADIAPDGGDGIVDRFDLAALVDNWLAGPQPGRASNPSPADNAIGVSTTADLNWTASSDAESHDVYFGTNNPPMFIHNQLSTTFEPDTMLLLTTYYWRIDAVNRWGKTEGTVWSFRTTGPGPG